AAIEIENVKQEANEEKLEGIQQNRLDIAYSLKEKGVSIEIISATTGLSEAEIRRL
ncbi:MAG: putative transposase YdaD, partial [Clostridium sp.]